MKFSNIPQLTAECNYNIEVRLDKIQKYIQEEQEEINLQLNPDFQRGHIWTEEQQIAYIEFLLKGGKSGRDIYFNNPNCHHNTIVKWDTMTTFV